MAQMSAFVHAFRTRVGHRDRSEKCQTRTLRLQAMNVEDVHGNDQDISAIANKNCKSQPICQWV
jgi:hypothetical protein